MDRVCLELAKIPVRPKVQLQIQSLKNAKQRLEEELQNCKANTQLRRYTMLQNDLQVEGTETPEGMTHLPALPWLWHLLQFLCHDDHQQEADRVIEALRAALEDQGCTPEQVNSPILPQAEMQARYQRHRRLLRLSAS